MNSFLEVLFFCLVASVTPAYLGRPGIVMLPPKSAIYTQSTSTTTSLTTTTTPKAITFETSFGDWIKGQNQISISRTLPDVRNAIEGKDLSTNSSTTRKFGRPDYGYSNVGILTPSTPSHHSYPQTIPKPYHQNGGPEQPYVSGPTMFYISTK